MSGFKCENLLKDKIKGYHGSPNIEADLERSYIGGKRDEESDRMDYTYFGFDKDDIVEVNKIWWKHSPVYKDKKTKGGVIEVEIDTDKVSLDPDRWMDLLHGGGTIEEKRRMVSLQSEWIKYIVDNIAPRSNHRVDKQKIDNKVYDLCKIMGDDIFKTTWFKTKERININKDNIVWKENG